MLIELSIKNFAIIDDIRISFSRGLSVLTGETGAGKSIIIEAVNLLLGGRVSGDLVRTGEENAELSAFFEIDPDSSAAKIMEDQEMDPSEGLMIRRIISSNGRHRLFINSKQSTMHMLKLVTKNLAGISSQHAHQGFLKQDNHIDILDQFAGIFPLRREVGRLYNKFSMLESRIAELKENLEKNDNDNEFLKFQIDEIEDAEILPKEDEKLEKQKKRLKNSSEIVNAVNRSINALYLTDNSIIEQLGLVKNDLEKIDDLDPVLGEKTEKISMTVLELQDLAEELRTYASTIELDTAALEKTETRLDLVQKLKRKYGGSLESLFLKYDELKKKISSTRETKKEIDQLTKDAENILNDLHEKSLALSEKRKAAGQNLGFLVEAEFNDLEMDGAGFSISIEPLNQFPAENIKYSAKGIDKVCFLMSPNPGEEPRPLNRIASGGELSRVVLALKAVLSETESLETLIFDEVDAGIGGKTSEKVGIKLKNLALDYQVICITHLAQIAKYGTSHFRIKKSVVNGRTSTAIFPLKNRKDRINEIARMIGGEEITPATINHAEEMLGFQNI